MRPATSHRVVWAGRRDFSFESTRALARNVDFVERVDALQIGNDSWFLGVRGEIYDGRVSSFQAHIVGFDISKSAVLDFDGLAASSVLDGATIPDSPRLNIEASDAEIACQLEDYCRRIDRIWSFFGGADIETLAKLATWMIQKRRTVEAPAVELSMICAAYIYGET